MPLKPLLKISPKSVLAGLVLHDQLGRIVEVRKNVNANSSLKIGDGYKPGMYFVELLQDNEKAILNIHIRMTKNFYKYTAIKIVFGLPIKP